tara:strand:+ start:426 stop:647 length:222 start_codon:yes stop_codon:yes gene_type:complete
MIGGLGWQELLIVLVILALLFGASRVADLGGALGRGIREFRTEAKSDDSDESSGEGSESETTDKSDSPKSDAS